MKLTIEVTQADIDKAIEERRQDRMKSITLCCPVAQAVKRLFPNEVMQEIGYNTIWLSNQQYHPTEPTEHIMTNFTLREWSDWHRQSPGSFEVTDEQP